VDSHLDAEESVMAGQLIKILQDNPVIASVKNDAGMRCALDSECRVVFLLYGSILNIRSIVRTLKEHGKIVFVDVDLLEGFANKEIVAEYLKIHTDLDGVLSSKAFMVKAAKGQGLFAVQRFFLIDSISYNNIPKQLKISNADCIEILPGCMPRVISWLVEDLTIPLIAGGLVCDKEDVVAALKAGATAIASSNQGVWTM
jgi:glycerol uptake operon antiterminator